MWISSRTRKRTSRSFRKFIFQNRQRRFLNINRCNKHFSNGIFFHLTLCNFKNENRCSSGSKRNFRNIVLENFNINFAYNFNKRNNFFLLNKISCCFLFSKNSKNKLHKTFNHNFNFSCNNCFPFFRISWIACSDCFNTFRNFLQFTKC